MRLTALAALSCLAVGTFCGLSCDRGRPAAVQEVVLYCSVDQEIAEPIIARFEAQTGVRVLPRFDTEAGKTVGLVQKIRAEADRPAADVFWSSEIFHTIALAREGLLAPHRSQQTESWPAKFADEQGRWRGFALRVRVIAYHTGRVKAEDAPRTLEDVLKPEWSGRLVMARPEFGTTGGDVASWFAHYGKEKAEVILRALKDNDIRLVDGNSTAVRQVATAQADVCFTDTDDVYAAQRNGWPLAMNPLNQGGAGALAIPNTVAVIKGAPHADAAAELADFLLSERVEEMLADSDSHNSPIHEGLAERFKQYRIDEVIEIDYEKVADELAGAIRTAGEIFP